MPLTPRAAGRVAVAVAVAAALSVGPLSAGPVVAQSAPVEIQVVGINDFHGHLDPRSGGASVAGVLGGAVQALRAEHPNTVFVSAGDNIGASPFISSSQQDVPTLDVLDAMGLAVSAVGNHEFDRGYADLAGRVSDRADFPVLGANVVGESPELPAYEIVRTGGVRVGFIGVVTRETASLVSPAGIPGITFEDPVAAANRVAAALSDDDDSNGEADVLVLLAHEGAATAAAAPPGATGGTEADCARVGQREDAFGALVRGVSADVDAILGGHTHLNVDCELPGPGGRLRPVLEAQQYGEAIARLRLTWDPSTGEVTASSGDVVRLTATSYPADPAVEAIVTAAAAAAEVIGREVIGSITADIPRARTASGAEDRGTESLLGNFIADVQLAATDGPDEGGAQIAFMNPGGLRADLLRATGPEAPGVITYAEAAVVQPFANTLFTLTLTGAQVRQVLEEQYQPDGSTRPFLALGVSRGLRYGFDDTAPRGSRIHSLTLNGTRIDPARTYRVVTNSFLASGGDNFRTLAQGTDRRDTGRDDLSVLVAHFRANSPITPDTTDRAVPGPAPVTPPPTPPTPPTTPPAAPPTVPPSVPPPPVPPLTGQVTAPPPVLDVPGTKRLAGADRYATAAAVAQDSFPTGPVPVAYVTTGEVAADALAAGPAADVQGGPVLLVGRDTVPAVTRAELTRLQPRRIVVLGGAAAVSDAVRTQLQAFTAGTVTRQAGADRYATAALVATSAFPSPVARVLLATGTGPADALPAGAAGARTDSPVLLTTRDRLPAPTVAALTQLRPRDITVVGGPAAVSDAVLAQLGAHTAGGTVVRAGGADRFATAALLAELVWPAPTPVVYLATGREPWDALTGVPAAGRDGAPVLLVEPTCMPAASKRQLDRLRPTTVVVLGGTSAVSARAASGTPC